ncbi:MAG: cytochrome c oxidase subunit III [Hyphomicrobiales bacterium]|nr:MAG: cytochrome c oxidase subunit III [Hyphomicrobiales bacterium]
MSIMGPIFLLYASIAFLWLWREGIAHAPWVQEGEVLTSHRRSGRTGAGKTGLIVFLAVALCLFSLMCAAFFMRMEAPDWQLPPTPLILWANTLSLIVSSAALQIAYSAARRRQIARTRAFLVACMLASLVFLLGQIWAWRELVARGLFASENPANAFFFLLTGAHGLHLIGGFVVLVGVTGPTLHRIESEIMTARLGLCATYWHFLLVVWLLLFMLISGFTDNVGVICRRLLY